MSSLTRTIGRSIKREGFNKNQRRDYNKLSKAAKKERLTIRELLAKLRKEKENGR